MEKYILDGYDEHIHNYYIATNKICITKGMHNKLEMVGSIHKGRPAKLGIFSPPAPLDRGCPKSHHHPLTGHPVIFLK